MSEKLFEVLSDENQKENKILYLTFMETLAEEIKNDLNGLDPNNILTCQTYNEFIKSSFKNAYNYYKDEKYNLENNRIEKLKNFEYFYLWFIQSPKIPTQNIQKEFTYLKQKGINKRKEISNNDRDAASIVYLFFRSFEESLDYTSFEGSEKLKAFKETFKVEKDLSDSILEIIFNYCKFYEKHLKDHNFFDDNIAASILCKLFEQNEEEHFIEKYDAIIVDEIQDLTKTQIRSLLKIVKDHKFYGFGDDNQSINPSLIHLRDIEGIIRDEYGPSIKCNKDVSYLTDVLRSSKRVVEYINLLNKIRPAVIGKGKATQDQELHSLVPDDTKNEKAKLDKPAYLFDYDSFKNMLANEDLFINNEIGIIAPSFQSKKELIDSFKFNREQDLYSIEEIKGREKKIIILYKFFSSSKDVWKQIANTYSLPDQRKLYSTLKRRFFNRYYVGLTRAKEKIIIFEDSDLDESIKNCFLRNKDCTLEYISDIDSLNEYFSNDFTHDQWRNKAEKYFKLKDYQEAFNYMSNAVKSYKQNENIDQNLLDKYQEEKERYEIYANYKKFLENDGCEGFDKDKVNQIIDLLIKEDEINDLEETIYKKHQKEKYKLLELINNNENYNALKQYEKVKNNLTETEKNYFCNKLLDCYSKIIQEKMGGYKYGR